MASFIHPRLIGLALLAAALVANADAGADAVERDDLPSSPHDLDAELTKIDPSRSAADALRGIGQGVGDFDDDPFTLITSPTNPRIIDIEHMRARDCVLDRIRGGICVLRGFDDDPERIDVDRYGVGRAHSTRYEILERIIDGLDVLDL